MIYLIDTLPNICPNCGYDLWDTSHIELPSGVAPEYAAFYEGDVWECGGCDARFAYASTEEIEGLILGDLP